MTLHYSSGFAEPDGGRPVVKTTLGCIEVKKGVHEFKLTPSPSDIIKAFEKQLETLR
jgi:hypothetical protein